MTDTEIAGDTTVPDPQPGLPTYDPRPWLELRVLADAFARVQQNRIAISNQIGAGAMPPEIIEEILNDYNHSENLVRLAMVRKFRKVAPEIREWSKSDAAVGIGEHLLARLLGVIGHPVIAVPHRWVGTGSDRVLEEGEPFRRNLYKLYSYAGVGDPSRKRRKGMSESDAAALGNPRAGTILHIMAEGTIKCVGSAITGPVPSGAPLADTSHQSVEGEALTNSRDPLTGDLSVVTSPQASEAPTPRDGDDSLATVDDDVPTKPRIPARKRSPYRDIYDLGREKYADRVDDKGEPWSLMHCHRAALRLVKKAILKDLWLIAGGGQLVETATASGLTVIEATGEVVETLL